MNKNICKDPRARMQTRTQKHSRTNDFYPHVETGQVFHPLPPGLHNPAACSRLHQNRALSNWKSRDKAIERDYGRARNHIKFKPSALLSAFWYKEFIKNPPSREIFGQHGAGKGPQLSPVSPSLFKDQLKGWRGTCQRQMHPVPWVQKPCA